MFKVGDRVKDVTIVGAKGTVAGINTRGELSIHWDGSGYDPTDTVYWHTSDFAPVTEEPESPVRTVTRKEIVEGRYGAVRVKARQISVVVDPTIEGAADRLRKAAATLLTLAEVAAE